MRFMMLVIPEGYGDAEPGTAPDAEASPGAWLSPEARGALTLRLVGGLTTEEVARAFLVPVPTLAQRIVRAKRTL